MRGFQPMARQIKTGPINKPANGGAVRGLHGFAPGAMAQALNQQPDSIPAMMKPGEYVLPPDTVAAMGGPQALDATVAQTHTPANVGAIVPKGFEPKHFFANGGLVEDEQPQQAPTATPTPAPDAAPGGQPATSRGFSPAAPATPSPTPAQTPRAQFVADQNAKLAAANARLAERTQEMNARYQPALNSPTNTFPGNRLPVESGAASVQPASAAPAQKSSAGSTGAAAPERTPEQLAKQLGGLDRQHAQNVQLQAAARTPEQARAEVQQTEGLAQLRGLPGVYQHGKGQYSDNAQGMGLPQNLGQPSAQNMQAANAMASQQQAQSMARLQAAERQSAPQARGLQGFEMPRQENAYERENRMRERNRIMGLLQTPMTGDPRRDLTSSQRQQLVAQLGHESQERQATERNMFGLAGQQLNAEAQRYSTDASTAVGVARNAIYQQRLGLDGQSLANEQRQQAITNDLAERRLALDDRKAGTANVPSGYRASADGQGLEAIPGGPADPRQKNKPLNETQSKSLAFGARMQQSGEQLNALAEQGVTQPGSIKRAADAVGAGVLANWTQSGEQQQVEQSQRDYVNAVLRRESGAAISNAEFDNARQQYFPQPGDKPQVIEQKRRNRLLSTQAMLAEVPNSAERLAQLEQMIGGSSTAPNLSQGAQDGQGGQPPQRRVARTGTHNGRRVVQYEDGSLSYAD